jgi:phospholipase A1
MKMLKLLIIAPLLMILAFSVSAETVTKPEKSKQTEYEKVLSLLASLTPEQKTALQKRMQDENKAANNPASLILYQPTYIMPFYYTGSPDQAVYQGTTPLDQKIMSSELKAQLSVQEPVIKNFFGKNNSLNVSYTQVAYWQVYAKSQYFRETDYMPSIFYR